MIFSGPEGISFGTSNNVNVTIGNVNILDKFDELDSSVSSLQTESHLRLNSLDGQLYALKQENQRMNNTINDLLTVLNLVKSPRQYIHVKLNDVAGSQCSPLLPLYPFAEDQIIRFNLVIDQYTDANNLAIVFNSTGDNSNGHSFKLSGGPYGNSFKLEALIAIQAGSAPYDFYTQWHRVNGAYVGLPSLTFPMNLDRPYSNSLISLVYVTIPPNQMHEYRLRIRFFTQNSITKIECSGASWAAVTQL